MSPIKGPSRFGALIKRELPVDTVTVGPEPNEMSMVKQYHSTALAEWPSYT